MSEALRAADDRNLEAMKLLEDFVIHHSMGWELDEIVRKAEPLVRAYQEARRLEQESGL